MINEFKVKSKELLKKIEDLINEGNIRRIIIKDSEGKVFIEVPLTIGVIGTIAAPVMAAIGALAGLVSSFSIEVIRKDDSITEEQSKDENIKQAEFTKE